MGLLTEATPLSWQDSLQFLEYVRKHGVEQFLNSFDRAKDFTGDKLFYGDEIEYGLFKLDRENKKVFLSLRGKEVMHTLQAREKDEGRSSDSGQCNWVPEYGAWMVEATPAEPYGGFTSDLRRVEANMRARRARLLSVLKDDEIAPTVVSFPLMGVGDFTGEGYQVRGPKANSRFVPDEIINPHPRFGTLTRNIRERRGRNVKIMVPLFEDKNTDMTPEDGADGTPGIYMDAMAFGMGMCCLQVTFQARDLSESRHLYDGLAVLAPIFLALSAASPIYKGKLSDWDARWRIIEDSVDCRTPAESGEIPPEKAEPKEYLVAGGVRRLKKSRYSSIDMYICNHLDGQIEDKSSAKFNDVEITYDQEYYQHLRDSGLDHLLAMHVAHLFVRDPLVLFENNISELDDKVETAHFESLQSTNWNSVRWKPPPLQEADNRKIGWRTEFRTMDIQATDFENAAFAVFTTLVSRVLLAFDLNMYIPISKNDENMDRAHARNAATDQKFWFRCHLVDPEVLKECPSKGECCQVHSCDDMYEEMTILQILTGKGGYFPGLVPLVMAYMQQVGFDPETSQKVQTYMSLLVKRASGELMTGASYIRKFVTGHPEYKQDSIVSEPIAYDLMVELNEIGLGLRPAPGLLGDTRVTRILKENAYNVPLKEIRMSNSAVSSLLSRYAKRAEYIQKRKKLEQALVELEAQVAELKLELEELDANIDHEELSGSIITIPGLPNSGSAPGSPSGPGARSPVSRSPLRRN